jgi:phosphoserine phosphatase
MTQNKSDQYLLLFTVAGPDGPGITAKLMSVIHESGDILKDMGQAVTHGLLSLSFLVEIKNRINGESHVVKELLYHGSQMNLNVTFQEIKNSNDIPGPIVNQEKFILNCVAPQDITARFVSDVAQALSESQINILRIDNVRPAAFEALEITTVVPEHLDYKKIKEKLLQISTQHQIDIAFLKDNVFRRSKRLIVFDMDSTLIQTEVIDEMADVMGAGAEVRAVTEAAMNGELDFDESLRRRVSKLKGLKVTQMQKILENLPFTPGVEEFVKTVKGLGYKVALISGGFSFFANALKEKLDLDYAFANDLVIEEGALTGEVEGTIINAQQKALLVKVISQQEKISLEQVVAIGDGANDLPMLSTAGLGIAFHAKDVVRREAQNHMSHGPMTSILYFLGIPRSSENDKEKS